MYTMGIVQSDMKDFFLFFIEAIRVATDKYTILRIHSAEQGRIKLKGLRALTTIHQY